MGMKKIFVTLVLFIVVSIISFVSSIYKAGEKNSGVFVIPGSISLIFLRYYLKKKR